MNSSCLRISTADTGSSALAVWLAPASARSSPSAADAASAAASCASSHSAALCSEASSAASTAQPGSPASPRELRPIQALAVQPEVSAPTVSARPQTPGWPLSMSSPPSPSSSIWSSASAISARTAAAMCRRRPRPALSGTRACACFREQVTVRACDLVVVARPSINTSHS